MTVAEFVVDEIMRNGVTDAFGIPGGVILRFLYALDKKDGIEPHLTYNEQTAAFAACGYAQASGKLGVAYATRGPGISNMFTAIAEAFQESIPVLFITSHGNREAKSGVRFLSNQEMDIITAVQGITKLAANVDKIEDVESIIKQAIKTALSGRKGPVLIDMSAGLWNKEISTGSVISEYQFEDWNTPDDVADIINAAKRPILLIGDGLRYGVGKDHLVNIFEQLKLPILSSRGSQDLLSGSQYYFGYVGSHGCRYSNFILSKADLIVVIGNRMAFPFNSASFKPVLEKKIIRVDLDEGELKRQIPGEDTITADGTIFLENIKGIEEKNDWLDVCRKLKNELLEEDCTEIVNEIAEFIDLQSKNTIYVCDVGNNEFWFARAYEKCQCEGKVLASKSFGTLGSAIGKSIGAYYATRENVVCVVGDQGFQYNIQELQYLAQHQIPIHILLINNECSRMIADHESGMFDYLLHTDSNNGYATPDFIKIARAYGVVLTELKLGRYIALTPYLPKGRTLQDMEPALDREKYEALNRL